MYALTERRDEEPQSSSKVPGERRDELASLRSSRAVLFKAAKFVLVII